MASFAAHRSTDRPVCLQLSIPSFDGTRANSDSYAACSGAYLTTPVRVSRGALPLAAP
jgi:hypothetical protein